MTQTSGVYYGYPETVDPAAESITVQETREGNVQSAVFHRLRYEDLPPTAARCGTRGYCFGDVGVDTRQVFLHYDDEGQAKALFAYRDKVWGWQHIGKYRERQQYGLLLQFGSDFMLRAFQRMAQSAMTEGGPAFIPLYVGELQAVPQRVPLPEN